MLKNGLLIPLLSSHLPYSERKLITPAIPAYGNAVMFTPFLKIYHI
jgi:hypothetical protein